MPNQGRRWDADYILEAYFYERWAEVSEFRNADGLAIAHLAARAGNYRALANFVSFGVDAVDAHGFTPLSYAVVEGRLCACLFLLRNGAHINCASVDGFTPLHYASSHAAIYDDGLAILMAILGIACYVDLHRRSQQGYTPLHLAASVVGKRSRMVCELLLLAGADAFARDSEGRVPSDVAKEHENHDAAEFLSDFNAGKLTVALSATDAVNMSPRERSRSLLDCLHNGLIAEGHRPQKGTCHTDSDDSESITLHHAALFASHGDIMLAVLAFLLTSRRFGDVNVPSRTRVTPLHYAVLSGSSIACELLFVSGADLFAKDRNNMTPVDYAQQWGNVEVKKFMDGLWYM